MRDDERGQFFAHLVLGDTAFSQVICENSACHATQERDFNPVREQFLDFSAHKEARLQGMGSHLRQISLDVLQLCRVTILFIKGKQVALDDLGCLALHADMDQVAYLSLGSTTVLPKLDERFSFVLDAEVNHVAFRLFRFYDSLQHHTRRDRLTCETPIDQLRVETELQFPISVSTRLSLVVSRALRKHAGNDELAWAQTPIAAVLAEIDVPLDVSCVVHDRILSRVHFIHCE